MIPHSEPTVEIEITEESDFVHTLVPEMKRKSWERDGSKNAIFFATVSYAATYTTQRRKIIPWTERENIERRTVLILYLKRHRSIYYATTW